MSAVLRSRCSIIALALTFCSVQPLMAQEVGGAPETSTEPSIDEIIVTATKREQALKDVPMAVDVATGEDLEKFKLFDFKDIPALAPGLQLTSNGRNTIATLRGISFNPDIGGPAAIGVYFNEVPVDINLISTGMYDVQQIEVLRGPQGTLRGRTAPAGANTITTRRASLDDATGQFQATVTDEHGRNFQGGVSMPLVQGKLGLRVAGLVDRNRGNRVFNITRAETGRQRTESVRATLSFEPAENLSGNIVYQYLDSDLRQTVQVFGPGNQPSLFSPLRSGPAIDAGDRQGVAEGLSRYTNRTHLLVGDLRWTFGDYSLSALGGFQNVKLFTQSDQDTGNAVIGYSQFLTVPSPSKNYTAELRLDSDHDGMFNFTLGVFYNKNKAHSPSTFRVDSFFANAVPRTPFPASQFALPITASVNIFNNTEDLAGFGNLRFQLTDRLRVEAGARITRNKAYAQSFLTVTSPGGVGLPIPGFTNPSNLPTVAPAFETQVDHPLTGTASISYDWTPDVTTYATYGRSFRRGSAQLGVTAALDSSLLVLQPERSDAVEIGLKSSLFDRRASFNIAAYYQKFDGFIGLTSVVTSAARNGVVDSGTFTASFNGDAIAKGIEMQFDAKLASFWDAALGMSYNKSRYDNALAPCNDFNFDGMPDSNGTPAVPVGQQVSVCRLNSRLNNSPEFALTATSEVRAPVGFGELFLRGLFTHQAGYTIEEASFRVPSNNNLDLFGGVRSDDGAWELSVFARNLFNASNITGRGAGELQASTRYLTTPPPGSLPAPPFRSGYQTVTTRLPRELGITASFRF